jgi:Skp family chaperone for outer membrane proteins
MKLLIGAAAAAFVMAASPAFAQATMTPNCTGFEAAPTLPDGATASRAEIEAANTRVQAWAEARRAKLVTCQADITAMSQTFNATEQERRATTAAWDAEVAEFNAREQSGSSNRRQRGGVLTRPDQ